MAERLTDKQVTDLVDMLRSGAALDNKVQMVTNVKSAIKQHNVPETCIPQLFEALRNASTAQHAALVNAGFTALGHLLTRLSRQEPKHIGKEAVRTLPVIIEKLGDQKDKYRTLAAQALTTIYAVNASEVERMVRATAMTGKNPRAKEAALHWLLQVRSPPRCDFLVANTARRCTKSMACSSAHMCLCSWSFSRTPTAWLEMPPSTLSLSSSGMLRRAVFLPDANCEVMLPTLPSLTSSDSSKPTKSDQPSNPPLSKSSLRPVDALKPPLHPRPRLLLPLPAERTSQPASLPSRASAQSPRLSPNHRMILSSRNTSTPTVSWTTYSRAWLGSTKAARRNKTGRSESKA